MNHISANDLKTKGIASNLWRPGAGNEGNAMITIRGGKTATLQVALGRYRISYAPNATQHEANTGRVA